MQSFKPPIVFAAKAPRLVMKFPDGPDQLWQADLKASRHGVQCDVFKGVYFVESNGTAFVYGIEFEDGYPQGFQDDLARKQQAFVQYLRAETRQDNDSMGLISRLFHGYAYVCEGKATAAYIAARATDLAMGVGYWSDTGAYELVKIEAEEATWVADARCTVPFEQLA